MIGLIVLLVFLLLVCFLLFTPLLICIDTVTNEYYVWLRGVGKVSLDTDPEKAFCIRVRILFMRWQFCPFDPTKKAKTDEKKAKKSKPRKTQRKRKRGSFMTMGKMMRVLRSFRVKRFRIYLDTGDFITNSYLYPIFYFLNGNGRELEVNFVGETQVQILVQNRLARIVYALIR